MGRGGKGHGKALRKGGGKASKKVTEDTSEGFAGEAIGHSGYKPSFSEEDSDLDSDEAFESGDEAKYGEFFTSKSGWEEDEELEEGAEGRQMSIDDLFGGLGDDSFDVQDDEDDVPMGDGSGVAGLVNSALSRTVRRHNVGDNVQESQWGAGAAHLSLDDMVGALGKESTLGSEGSSIGSQGELRKRVEHLRDQQLLLKRNERLENEAARAVSLKANKKILKRWDPQLMEEQRRRTLNLIPEDRSRDASTVALTHGNSITDDLEDEINDLLNGSGVAGVADHQRAEKEELAMRKLSKKEIRERTGQLRKMRFMLSSQEKKAQLRNKIKSKAFRKILRRDKRNAAENMEEDLEEEEVTEEDRLKDARLRAKERMKIATGSKWADRAKKGGSAAYNKGSRAALNAHATRRSATLRAMNSAGAEAGDSADESEDEAMNQWELKGLSPAEQLSKLEADPEASFPQKGLMGLKFIHDGVKRERKAAKTKMAAFDRDLAREALGEFGGDTDTDSDAAGKKPSSKRIMAASDSDTDSEDEEDLAVALGGGLGEGSGATSISVGKKSIKGKKKAPIAIALPTPLSTSDLISTNTPGETPIVSGDEQETFVTASKRVARRAVSGSVGKDKNNSAKLSSVSRLHDKRSAAERRNAAMAAEELAAAHNELLSTEAVGTAAGSSGPAGGFSLRNASEVQKRLVREAFRDDVDDFAGAELEEFKAAKKKAIAEEAEEARGLAGGKKKGRGSKKKTLGWGSWGGDGNVELMNKEKSKRQKKAYFARKRAGVVEKAKPKLEVKSLAKARQRVKRITRKNDAFVVDNEAFKKATSAKVSTTHKKSAGRGSATFKAIIKAKVGTARSDASLPHVIISQRRDKRAAALMVANTPQRTGTREQFEATMSMPLGAQWTTMKSTHVNHAPEVKLAAGNIIGAIQYDEEAVKAHQKRKAAKKEKLDAAAAIKRKRKADNLAFQKKKKKMAKK